LKFIEVNSVWIIMLRVMDVRLDETTAGKDGVNGETVETVETCWHEPVQMEASDERNGQVYQDILVEAIGGDFVTGVARKWR